jgi:hypothetical protein
VIITAIEAVLNADGPLLSLVGLDANGFPKIYSSVTARPPDDEPPFVSFAVFSGPAPTGTYKNNEAIYSAVFQVTSWGRTSLEAWQIQDEVEIALLSGAWGIYLLPSHFMQIMSLESPGELPDRDTKWRQIPRRWRVDFDRG